MSNTLTEWISCNSFHLFDLEKQWILCFPFFFQIEERGRSCTFSRFDVVLVLLVVLIKSFISRSLLEFVLPTVLVDVIESKVGSEEQSVHILLRGQNLANSLQSLPKITLDEFVILIIIGICREEILVDIEESLFLDNFLKFKSVKYLADFLIDLFIEQDVE